ncbi:High mobility group protein B1 [Tupaia chinensis]|uniref:High mobility group protein B1 n=1 Tax=Tupaia chinensis TaxID=246437 RepID=L9KT66_TUPCH|nr:High mobility group protein B1 [Tupaia chinensis]
MSSYTFFVQTCWEEHKKQHPDASVNFSEFSKKCSERWKTMSANEKAKFEDTAKSFSCYVLNITQKPKSTSWTFHCDVAKKLGEMWNNTAADDKQPYEKKAAKLKEKYEKDIAAYRAKGKPDAAKKRVVKAEKSKKNKEEEENEEDEDEEEEDEEDEDEEEDDDDDE